MKVFGVGFIKTGTSTLGAALEALGYNHRHGSYRVGNELLSMYLSGQYDVLDRFVVGHDSFDDFPFCAPGMYRTLDQRYPDSKFILTLRHPGSWFDSLSGYLRGPGGKTDLMQARGNDGLPLGPNYGLVNYLLATFGTVAIDDNRDHYIRTYQQYNESVMDYFRDRPDQLLRISWMDGEGWEPLCSFLGKDVPQQPFPHINAR